MENYIEDSHIHDGHRGRMRSKLLSHGGRIFDTYELLEMLLYHSVPYKDTNPIAKRLLSAFGGLDGVMRAEKEELTEVSGVGERTAELIMAAGKLGEIIGAEVLPAEEINLSSYDAVGSYLVNYFSGMEEKCVVALFLDSSMRLIRLKKLYDLEYDSGGVKARAFIDEAVASRAAVVISAHNHPFGPFYPTPGDRATNTVISEALNKAGFIHAEHYLICGRNYAGIGSINNFTEKIKRMPAVSQFMESRNPVEGEMTRVCSTIGIDGACYGFEDAYNKRDFDYFCKLISFAAGKESEKISLALLKKYRTIENLLTASVMELEELCGEKCCFFLKLLAYLTGRRTTEKLKVGERYTSAQIAEYFKAVFLGESIEKIYLMSFDASGRVIRCDLLAEGTVTSSEILPRKAIETAISASASSVSIAHNHPFGTARPSVDDVNMTKHFADIFRSCDITLIDHYVVAGQLCNTVYIEIV